MAPGHFLHETPQCMQHVAEGLPRLWLRVKDDEIDRMAFAHRHANFGLTLESSNARSMACAWVNDNYWRFFRIDTIVPTVFADLSNSHQGVVCGPIEAERVKQRSEERPEVTEWVSKDKLRW